MTTKSAYLAFDLYPSSKGAATHITQMAECLFEHCNGGTLVTLGDQRHAPQETLGSVTAHRFVHRIPNFLQRAQAFSGFVTENLAQYPELDIVHFRDIWSGVGALNTHKSYQTVFEINGLPSIELPYHYPGLSTSLLHKIEQLELSSMQRSDTIIVPANVIKQNLISKGIDAQKITVVPNAANPKPELILPKEQLGDYLIYFGAMQPWQGIDVLLNAFARLKDIPNLRLLICAAGKPRSFKHYQRMARRLKIDQQIIWKHQLSKAELNGYISTARLSVAPLTECSRNLLQGCSPLKIFESMACRTPIISSKLPVVEEILQDGIDAKLIKADRPQELARSIRLLLEYPELGEKMAENAYQLVASKYNWQSSRAILKRVYRNQ